MVFRVRSGSLILTFGIVWVNNHYRHVPFVRVGWEHIQALSMVSAVTEVLAS